MSGYTDKEILEGLKIENPHMIRFIYRHYFPAVRALVLRFKNLILDPDDVFQEGITRSILMIRQGRFREECRYSTFLFGICRNVCLKATGPAPGPPADQTDCPAEEDPDSFERYGRLLRLMENLSDICRTIICLRFGIQPWEQESPAGFASGKTRFEDIAEVLGMHPDNARQRFKRCLDELRDRVKSDKVLSGYFIISMP